MYENSSGIGGLYETLAQETGVDWQWTGEWGDTVHNYYKGSSDCVDGRQLIATDMEA